MKISEFVELSDDRRTLIVTGRRSTGFGLGRTDVPMRDVVRILPAAEFERLLAECAPTGHRDIGLNAGAPVDGLEEYRGQSGIRYLVDATGPGRKFVYADAASVELVLNAIRTGNVTARKDSHGSPEIEAGMTTPESLADLCGRHRGKHLSILDGIVCLGAWPVVDADGLLTGEISEGTGGTLVDLVDGKLVAHDGACEAIKQMSLTLVRKITTTNGTELRETEILQDHRGFWLHDCAADPNSDALQQIEDDSDTAVQDALTDGWEIASEELAEMIRVSDETAARRHRQS